MKILAVDTSSSICSVALLEDDKLIDKNELDDGRTHSENLMPILDELLKRNSIDISKNPEYELKLINRTLKTNEEQIANNINQNSILCLKQ